jgi:hypothetical protein
MGFYVVGYELAETREEGMTRGGVTKGPEKIIPILGLPDSTGQLDRCGMPAIRDADLISPREPLFRVRGELDVIGRVGVDEVIRIEDHPLEVATCEPPSRESGCVFLEMSPIMRRDGPRDAALRLSVASAGPRRELSREKN